MKRILKKEPKATLVIKKPEKRSAFFKDEWDQEEKRLLRWK